MLLTLLKSYLRTKYCRNFKSFKQLENWQEKQVQHHLDWVLPRSPFYRNRINKNQWRQSPPIDKSLMMEHFNTINTAGISKEQAFDVALKSEESRNFTPVINEIAVGLSSGTSGNRGLFLVSPTERYSWAGTLLAKCLPKSILKPQKVALVLRANNNLYTTLQSKRIQFRFFDLLDPLEKTIQDLIEYQPDIIAAPPSILLLLRNIKPKKVISIAEVLDPLDEKKLTESFEQPIHQIYQCTEGFLATTCKKGTLHLNEDLVVIQKEYLEEHERKFIPIITDFSRFTQPIIRYRLNDILTEAKYPCTCGSPMTALESIEGRCDDIFYLKPLHGDTPIPIIPDFIRRAIISSSDAIQEYQAIQHRPDLITIAFASPEHIRKDIEKKIEHSLTTLFNKKNCQTPQLSFSQDLPKPSDKKLRRIKRGRLSRFT